MNKQILLPSFVIIAVMYAASIIFNQNTLSEEIENPEYQKYISEYRQLMNEELQKSIDENVIQAENDLHYQSTSSAGTSSNFEGPQVHLKGIKFHDEYLTREDERLKHIDPLSAHFDPDHAFFGLPDVKISIQDVRLYQPEKGPIAEFLDFGAQKEPRPYKVYKKKILHDSIGAKAQYLVMQLWLTEFDVTIDIRPDRDLPVSISNEEKNNTDYPGFWYGLSQPRVKLKDLRKEHKDQRYGNLSFILEVIPDHSPIYVKTKNGASAKADFAIASIYCKNAKFGNEPDVQRINANIFSGQPVFLNNEFDLNEMNKNLHQFSDKLELNAAKLLEIKEKSHDFIWNKPYYLKLFFNNLGTWRSGLFSQNQFHDQVTYSFLMPVFVVGSWDMIAPQDILPAWNPPAPYIRKFTFMNLLPFWKYGFLGKLAGGLLIGLAFFVCLLLFFPGLLPICKRLLGF